METKDLVRLQDISKKSGGVEEKAVSLANHMAALIKDREKAYRRMEASQEVFGEHHPVTQVFLRRWHILNGMLLGGPVPVAPPEKEKKVATSVAPPEDKILWGSTLPPVGEEVVNPKTLKGMSKGVLEVWESWTKEIFWVVNPSETPRASIDTITNFFDDNGNFLFGGKMIDWCSTDHKEAAQERWGKPEDTRRYL